MVKPKLYVPDYKSYAAPFEDQFTIVHNQNKPYDPKDMGKCDFLMLTGGGDIDPKYYGHKKSVRTSDWGCTGRDELEFKLLEFAMEKDMPVIGICRGAQWLTVIAGGSLIQHVTGHMSGYHNMHTEDGLTLQTSSLHHQMCNLSGLEKILFAWSSNLSSMYLGDGDSVLFPKGLTKEPEVFYLPQVRGFCVQGHPEMMDKNAPANVFVRNRLAEVFNL